jgi:hypothetical protein
MKSGKKINYTKESKINKKNSNEKNKSENQNKK